ncbi:MAG: hypothetical protein GY941_18555 [Planctomycetes bacterium]|nr:hypothetical protein [Planctomycetota bacterium]
MYKVIKDPEAVLDYGFDWGDWLNADTIATSTWVVDTGLTKDSDSETTTVATVWLSGGTAGRKYKAVNTITTAGGRTDERILLIIVKNK